MYFEWPARTWGGYNLVSSGYSWLEAEKDPPLRRKARLLKEFPKNNPFYLQGLSPCGQYAYVLHKDAFRVHFMRGNRTYTYYVVDTCSGKTFELIKDVFFYQGIGVPSMIYWVGGCE